MLKKSDLQDDLLYVRGQLTAITQMAKDQRIHDEELYHIVMTVPKMLVVVEEAIMRRLRALEYEKSLKPKAKKVKPIRTSGRI